jgi:hypothetical protein
VQTQQKLRNFLLTPSPSVKQERQGKAKTTQNNTRKTVTVTVTGTIDKILEVVTTNTRGI